MGGEEGAAEKKLHDAASKGDLTAFQQLLQQDPDLLDRVSSACSNRSPLHTATLQGSVEIVQEVLNRNPKLARELDSGSSSSLHIAAAQGNVEIASLLLSAAPDTCWWRDCHGANPVHIAAMNGHVELLKELLRLDSFPAMERVSRGQTVLHLCVKHRQLPALMVLAEKLVDLICAKDDDGDTVLHLAVRCRQVETVRYLVESKKIERETTNSMGKTAMDILNGSPMVRVTYIEIKSIMKKLEKKSPFGSSLPKLADMTMVVAVLIATMAFQAATSPPGGVWQDNMSGHKAGEAVMGTTHPKIYPRFVNTNISAFVSSLVTITLISTGLTSYSYPFLIAAYAMGMSMTSIAYSYVLSLSITTPEMGTQVLVHAIIKVVVQGLALTALIYVSCRTLNLFSWWKSQKRQLGEEPTPGSPIQRLAFPIFRLLNRS